MTDTANPPALSPSSLPRELPIAAPQFLPWTPGDPIPPYTYIAFSIDTQAEADKFSPDSTEHQNILSHPAKAYAGVVTESALINGYHRAFVDFVASVPPSSPLDTHCMQVGNAGSGHPLANTSDVYIWTSLYTVLKLPPPDHTKRVPVLTEAQIDELELLRREHMEGKKAFKEPNIECDAYALKIGENIPLVKIMWATQAKPESKAGNGEPENAEGESGHLDSVASLDEQPEHPLDSVSEASGVEQKAEQIDDISLDSIDEVYVLANEAIPDDDNPEDPLEAFKVEQVVEGKEECEVVYLDGQLGHPDDFAREVAAINRYGSRDNSWQSLLTTIVQNERCPQLRLRGSCAGLTTKPHAFVC